MLVPLALCKEKINSSMEKNNITRGINLSLLCLYKMADIQQHIPKHKRGEENVAKTEEKQYLL